MNNEYLIETFLSHLSHDIFLDDDEVCSLLRLYPLASYNGEAYRILFFSNETEYRNADLSFQQDKSFTKTLDGIKYFMDVKTPPSNTILTKEDEYLILVKVQVEGLDVSNLAKLLKSKSVSVPEYAFREQEIIPLSIGSPEILYSGKLKDFSIPSA